MGAQRLGNDVADHGADSSASVLRWENVAKLVFHMTNTGPSGMAQQVGVLHKDLHPHVIMIDRVGVGAGTYDTLHRSSGGIELITKGVNTGEASPSKDFMNMKAWLAWEFKKWIVAGGKLVYDERWMQILTVLYRVTESKVEIMSKKERRKRNMPSPDAFEALCLTFYPVQDYHVPVGTPLQPGAKTDGEPKPNNPVDNFRDWRGLWRRCCTVLPRFRNIINSMEYHKIFCAKKCLVSPGQKYCDYIRQIEREVWEASSYRRIRRSTSIRIIL